MSIVFKLTRSGLTKTLKSSFRVRLFTGITVVILVVCSGFASLLMQQQYQSQIEKRVSEGNLMAKLLARDVRLAVFSGNRNAILQAAQGTMSIPGIQSVEVFDKQGRLISRLANPTEENVHYSSFSELIPGLLNIELEKSLFVGNQWGGDPAAAIGSVKVVIDDSKTEERLHKLILMAIVATTIFLAFGVIAAFLLAKSMTRPISVLSACATALKNGDDSVRAPIETADEIGQLATTFNSMVEAIRIRTKDLEEALEELYHLNLALEEKVEKRTSQLKNANRELESFNYSASHDLRAPLNRLDAFCAAFREEYGDTLDEQGRYYLNRITATGEQMSLVLSAMQILYQVQQREMTPRRLDISELVSAVAASLKQKESDREVQFVIQENVQVYGDMKLIWLALENLIGNAWKFTKRKTAARIEFGETISGTETACFIRDNGAGFDMAYYDQLFVPFQRLHNYEEFPGTGIGLAIVQRIISRHGGRIWFESSEGIGTTCYFILPDGGAAEIDAAKGNS